MSNKNTKKEFTNRENISHLLGVYKDNIKLKSGNIVGEILNNDKTVQIVKKESTYREHKDISRIFKDLKSLDHRKILNSTDNYDIEETNKKEFSDKEVKELAIKFNINLKTIPLQWWKYGLNVELEHGKQFGTITNVTDNDGNKTAQIVIAHLIEFPDYYERLYLLEERATKYWKGRTKPPLFLG